MTNAKRRSGMEVAEKSNDFKRVATNCQLRVATAEVNLWAMDANVYKNKKQTTHLKIFLTVCLLCVVGSANVNRSTTTNNLWCKISIILSENKS